MTRSINHCETNPPNVTKNNFLESSEQPKIYTIKRSPLCIVTLSVLLRTDVNLF